MLKQFLHDIRYGGRRLLGAPAFAAIAAAHRATRVDPMVALRAE
jgi:hypothetical protein